MELRRAARNAEAPSDQRALQTQSVRLRYQDIDVAGRAFAFGDRAALPKCYVLHPDDWAVERSRGGDHLRAYVVECAVNRNGLETREAQLPSCVCSQFVDQSFAMPRRDARSEVQLAPPLHELRRVEHPRHRCRLWRECSQK